MKVKIIADSTCDLPTAIIHKLNIDIIPLHVILGEKSYSDGVDLTPQEIIDWSNETNSTPKTSAPTIEAFKSKFEKYINEGMEIIYIGVSSHLSATIQSATIAASQIESDNITIIDSLNISTGIGHLVYIAGKMAQNGQSASDIIEKINNTVDKIKTSFFVDSLKFLRRGGRCSALAAFGANTLKIRPQILVIDGKMTTGEKYRGSILKVCEKYCDSLFVDIEKMEPEVIFLASSPSDQKLVDKMVGIVESKNYFKKIIVGNAGSVITSHCGSNTLGIMYIEKS